MYEVRGPRGGKYECDTLAEARKLTKRGGTYRKVGGKKRAAPRKTFREWEKAYGHRQNPANEGTTRTLHFQKDSADPYVHFALALLDGKPTAIFYTTRSRWLDSKDRWALSWQQMSGDASAPDYYSSFAAAKRAAQDVWGNWRKRRNPSHNDMFDTLFLEASNDGRYHSHDPAGAVDAAWSNYQHRRDADDEADFYSHRDSLIAKLQRKWSGQDDRDMQDKQQADFAEWADAVEGRRNPGTPPRIEIQRGENLAGHKGWSFHAFDAATGERLYRSSIYKTKREATASGAEFANDPDGWLHPFKRRNPAGDPPNKIKEGGTSHSPLRWRTHHQGKAKEWAGYTPNGDFFASIWTGWSRIARDNDSYFVSVADGGPPGSRPDNDFPTLAKAKAWANEVMRGGGLRRNPALDWRDDFPEDPDDVDLYAMLNPQGTAWVEINEAPIDPSKYEARHWWYERKGEPWSSVIGEAFDTVEQAKAAAAEYAATLKTS